jgi:hypothetical protein
MRVNSTGHNQALATGPFDKPKPRQTFQDDRDVAAKVTIHHAAFRTLKRAIRKRINRVA